MILGTQSSGGEHAERLTVYTWVVYSDAYMQERLPKAWMLLQMTDSQ